MISRYLIAMGIACIAVPAAATITIFDSPGKVQPKENVLFQAGNPVGFNAFGVTKKSHTGITFLGTEPLLTPSNGQARVEAADGGLMSLDFFATLSTLGFSAVEFNIFGTHATAKNVTLSFFDQFNNVFSGTFSIGTGQNFFSALATDNEIISKIQIRLDGNVHDMKQFRVTPATIGNVPEPASWAMLLVGFGLVGAAARRRKFTQVAA